MNKILHQLQIPVLCIVIFFSTTLYLNAQHLKPNKYGLNVINKIIHLKKSIRQNPEKQLVNVKEQLHGIILDLRYAGTNNFLNQALYPPLTTTFLRKPVADSLKIVQEDLKNMGLGLKIFDAYRPWSVTQKMWNVVKDDRYAADPKKGSGHNRGIAVDITLVNFTTGEELNMGTGFDNFSDTAHHSFTQLPEDVLQNRLLLKLTMQKHGFKALETEWWHYSFSEAKNFELLDIRFNKLVKKNKSNIK